MALHHQNTSTDTAGAQCIGRHPFGANPGQNLQASCGRRDGGDSRDNVRGGGRTKIEDNILSSSFGDGLRPQLHVRHLPIVSMASLWTDEALTIHSLIH